MTKRMILATLTLALGMAGVALAGDDCHVPMERWQAPGAIVALAEGQGWEIERLKIDDGCYEIRGTDTEGRRFKVKLDPETLQVVEYEERDRRKRRDRDRTAPAGQAAAPPANSLIKQGGAPVAATD